MKVLVIDVGGTHIKALVTGRRTPVKIESGPSLSARNMVRLVRAATSRWQYDVVSIGFPGPVVDGRPIHEPYNLGNGWVRFDFARAFRKPVKVVNDAAMQALGSYEGGRMLFLGLGTGLGVAAVYDNHIVPMELGHLPYRHGMSFEDYLGNAGLKRLGRKRWGHHVHVVTGQLRMALIADYVVIGGGNARLLRSLPPHSQRGHNFNAFVGGQRLWTAPQRWRVRSRRGKAES